ncbi:TPR end-of-group domain-containing protein [uncultured Bacteroides sp.]|uniref:TPR end-of-group domain-containing protein n=1 Tax=uncultured Bacteroides sp. TaxID=162156 RepID=UPI002AA762D8|nr:tetratricopeptide repeat protein [uncultured Bacteroides sp.]
MYFLNISYIFTVKCDNLIILSMKKRMLLLLLIISTSCFAQQKRVEQQTYTQTEVDLKLQLQEQKIESLTNTINEQQAYINERLAQQDKSVTEACANYSDHISLWSTWMTAISIIAAIVLFLMGGFIAWRFRDISKDLAEKLQEIDKSRAKAEEAQRYAENAKSEIDELKSEVVQLKEQAEKSVSQIKAREIEVLKIAQSAPPQEQSEGNKEEISKYVEEAKKTKPESELTAEDWFLKGYDAQIKEQLEDACFYYKKAIELDPKDASAYYNSGNALLGLAKLKSDESLYQESFEKYAKAVELSANDASAYYNWGNGLLALAKLKSDELLYKEAFTKYVKAIKLEPKHVNAYKNYAACMVKYAISFHKLDEYKDKIEQMLLKANELKENSGSYNLACLYSRLKDKNKALKYLGKAFESKIDNLSRKSIELDEDFENIKNDPDFIALLDKCYPLK